MFIYKGLSKQGYKTKVRSEERKTLWLLIGETHGRHDLVVAGVLADKITGGEVPKASAVIRRSGDEIVTVSTECRVPHPALVARQRAVQLELTHLLVLPRTLLPELHRVVRRAGGERLAVWRE